MTTTTSTRTAAKPAAVKAPRFSVKTVDRFHGVVDNVPCKCANGHITKRAAESCIKSAAKPEKGTEITFTTQPRFWGVKDAKQCECKFGHKTEAAARRCVGEVVKAPAAKTAPAKPAAAKPGAAKPTAPKALRSSAEGTAVRA